VNASLYRSLSYDPIADFVPISLVTQLAYFVFVPNSSPARTIKELIDHAKSRPGQLTMASPGTGSAPFLAEMLFLQMAGIQMTHVPYRGASPALNDLISGRVDCYFGSGALLSYARSGQVRVLASTGPKRDAAAPELPTIGEAAVPGYGDPAIQDKLTKTGYLAGGSSPGELEALLKAEIAKWSGVIKSVGIKID
jgi:tripartite-type tricarboxylate transporter receptor subunit TctC